MTKFHKLTAVATSALALAAVAASPAWAATVRLNYFLGGTGPHGDVFAPSTPSGNLGALPATLPAVFLDELKLAHPPAGHVTCPIAKTCTYDFVFGLTGIAPGNDAQIQVQAQALSLGSQAIDFDVFSLAVNKKTGAPVLPTAVLLEGSASWLGTSSLGTNALFSAMLPDGFYVVQISPTYLQVAVSGESTSGSLIETAQVPEPMAWTLMLLGFGGVGAALRRTRMVASA
jgi:hypothetical protein